MASQIGGGISGTMLNGGYSSGQITGTGGTASTGYGSQQNMQVDLSSLQKGQTFTGQVTDIRNDGITIQLKEGYVMAKFAEAVDVAIGDILQFTIRENSDNRIVISAVRNQGLSGENGALYKALEGAGLAATDVNIDVVGEMLEQRMSVSREAIQEILAKVHHFPEADIKDIVSMIKYNIPVTKENIEQFVQYRNGTHHLSDTLVELAENFTDSFGEIVSVLGREEAGLLFEKMFGGQELPDGLQKISELLYSKITEPGMEDSSEAAIKKELQELLTNSTIKEEIKQTIAKAFSIEPAEVSADTVKAYYKEMDEGMQTLQRMLSETETMAKGLQKEITDIRENISFMRELNQQFIYAQLPVQIGKNITHSELFVYSKKKNLNSKEGIRMQVHLDMTHLGSMDIMVYLKESYLQLGFSLEDEETAALLKTNMNLLEDRLTEKGYLTSTTCSVDKKKESSILDAVFGESMTTTSGKPEIKRYSFDMRA